MNRGRSHRVVQAVVSALVASGLVTAGSSMASAARVTTGISTSAVSIGPLHLPGSLTLPDGSGTVPVVILVGG